MGNIHYIILIVSLLSIYLVFTFRSKLENKYQKKVKEAEKKIVVITEKKEALKLEPKVGQESISDVNYEKAKKNMLEKGLKAWKSLDTY